MKIYLRVLSYIKPFRKHLAASIIFTILYAILNGASITLTIPLLDTLFAQDSSVKTEQSIPKTINAPTLGWINEIIDSIITSFKEIVFSGSQNQILLKICLLLFFSFLLKNLFGYLQSYYLAFVEQGMIRDLRNQAYFHLHKLPMSYFKNEKTGNLISRLTNDVYVVQTSVSAVFLNMIREPFSILVFLLIALSISWHLTLFSLLVIPISAGIIGWIGLKLRKQTWILQDKMSEITTTLHETITGVKIVKAFGMEYYENKKFSGQTFSFFKTILKINRIRNAAPHITEVLSVIVGCVMIYFGGQLVLVDKTLSASEFITFLLAIFQMMPPIKELSSVNNRIQESSAAAERVFEILDTEPRIKNIESPINKSDFEESLEFKNVSFHYDDSDELILDSINIKVEKGNILAIVGSSGAGKTTMVDLIPRFYDPTNGKILIDGIDLKDVKLEDLRKLLGIVTQETILFNETVRSNISYGIGTCTDENLIAAAKAANAHNFIIDLPNGYDTIIGEKGTKLSGGQRQRLSIARALLKNPPIMILDEATSALDNESEVLVQEAIERLMAERTTFVIAHRLSTIRNAHRIIVLDKGKIVQDGKHDELLSQENGIYKKLYELQFRDQT
ncbi:MAG: ABC transporter ATP-binding protein MsbA family [Ignavibacteria bacterium]|nr:MAG: ABC transporter ATP-binding protein MsbA family [Ignavibacteria bacterium]KAF0161483.1 MAG: ABC transporter ATP-binding protein MsbA family [Ignavibacteria bacterium]